MSQPENEDGGGCDDKKGSLTMFFAGLMKDRSMSYSEILSHSMPFLEAISEQINRIRIIEAGGDPDGGEDDENGGSHYESRRDTVKSLPCSEPDDMFYGRLNELLR